MSIATIRSQLSIILGGVQGVARVYADEPNMMASPPDLPCFIFSFREPALSAQSLTNSSVDYTWHFNLTFLYKPEGLGNPDENMSSLEAFIKLTIDKLFANFTGAGTWTQLNKDTGGLEFTAGLIVRVNAATEQNRYWGWTATLDISESVATTMGTGS